MKTISKNILIMGPQRCGKTSIVNYISSNFSQYEPYRTDPIIMALNSLFIKEKVDKKQIYKRVMEVLELVGLKNKVRQYPNQLSGGEQQRVVIARAIVNNPKLIICDEPTGNLDPITSMEIMKVLEHINELGTTIVMATHDLEIVKRMKKRVIVIEEGRLVKDYEKGKYHNEGF